MKDYFIQLGRDLFATKKSGITTVILLFLISYAGFQVANWAVFDATFLGETRDDCTSGGACWVFINSHFEAFLYGSFYPVEERWRLSLGFGVLMVALAGLVLGSGQIRKSSLGFLALIFPFIGFELAFGLLIFDHVEMSKIGGLALTLLISYVGILSSLPFGIILALGRQSAMPLVKGVCVAFIEFWRGVPLITVLFMASVMIPLFLPEEFDPSRFKKLVRALIGVTLFSSAYMAEVIRGGLQSVSGGQSEAAEALGLSYGQKMWYVVLPQALVNVVPGIVNTFIGLLKDTTLVMIVGMYDLLGTVHGALTDSDWTGFSVEGYVFAGFVFWALCFGLSKASLVWEKKHG